MRVTWVLRDALAKTKKVAVGQLIMHGREHLVGITALYADTRSAWTPNFGGNGNPMLKGTHLHRKI
jgi:non-homologous end joining protein Ku